MKMIVLIILQYGAENQCLIAKCISRWVAEIVTERPGSFELHFSLMERQSVVD